MIRVFKLKGKNRFNHKMIRKFLVKEKEPGVVYVDDEPLGRTREEARALYRHLLNNGYQPTLDNGWQATPFEEYYGKNGTYWRGPRYDDPRYDPIELYWQFNNLDLETIKQELGKEGND